MGNCFGRVPPPPVRTLSTHSNEAYAGSVEDAEWWSGSEENNIPGIYEADERV